MNKKIFKVSILLVTLMLMLTSIIGCGSKVVKETVENEKISRVVVLTPSDYEILCAIGAKDIIVGKGEYCDYPVDDQDIKVVNSGKDTNIEEVINLNPDVVIMSMMAQTEEQIKSFEKVGIKVFISKAQDINGVYENINLLGELVNHEEQASELIDNMKKDFEDVRKKVGTINSKKTVYFEVSPLEYGLWTAGNNTFMNEIADILGLENVFVDVKGWAKVSEEQVIERNPDIIVTTTMYYGEGLKPEEEVKSRKGWEEIQAIKNARVINADNNAMTRPGPRLVQGAKELYEFIYKD